MLTFLEYEFPSSGASRGSFGGPENPEYYFVLVNKNTAIWSIKHHQECSITFFSNHSAPLPCGTAKCVSLPCSLTWVPGSQGGFLHTQFPLPAALSLRESQFHLLPQLISPLTPAMVWKFVLLSSGLWFSKSYINDTQRWK